MRRGAVQRPRRPRRSGGRWSRRTSPSRRPLDWTLQRARRGLRSPGAARRSTGRRTSPTGSRRLQGALAAGFARALRDRTLRQQERIARSAWQARDEVEQALRDSEARFRAVFTGAAIGIGIAGVDGRIIDVNQAFADMLGYSIEELRGINVAQLFHADDAAGMWELYQELIAGKHDARPGGEALLPQGRHAWSGPTWPSR